MYSHQKFWGGYTNIKQIDLGSNILQVTSKGVTYDDWINSPIKGWKKIFHAHSKQKRAWVATLI